METTFTLQELETIELAIGVLAELKRDERDFLDGLLKCDSNEVVSRHKEQNAKEKRVEQAAFQALIGKVQAQMNRKSDGAIVDSPQGIYEASN